MIRSRESDTLGGLSDDLQIAESGKACLGCVGLKYAYVESSPIDMA